MRKTTAPPGSTGATDSSPSLTVPITSTSPWVPSRHSSHGEGDSGRIASREVWEVWTSLPQESSLSSMLLMYYFQELSRRETKTPDRRRAGAATPGPGIASLIGSGAHQ